MNIPYCYYPSNWSIYKYTNFSREGNNFSGFLKQIKNSFYENDLPLIKIEASTVDDSILRIKIYDPLKKRYEPPWPLRTDFKPFSQKDINAKYKLDIDYTKPGFKVYRTLDDTVMWVIFEKNLNF